MILKSNCEFRGFSSKINEKGTFTKVNLEDYNGESASFSCDNTLYNILNSLKKGDKVIVDIEYNITFKSLKVVNLQKGDK